MTGSLPLQRGGSLENCCIKDCAYSVFLVTPVDVVLIGSVGVLLLCMPSSSRGYNRPHFILDKIPFVTTSSSVHVWDACLRVESKTS